MRFIIYGAGGVGGVVGAQLQKSGQDVVLIARGAHLDAIRAGGLHYQTPAEDVTLPMIAVGHPGDIAPRDDDLVILSMKTQHTQAALEVLHAARGDQIPVVCCQNGVANERMASQIFRNVYGMCVDVPAQFIEPGRIQCHAQPRCGALDLGVYTQGVDDFAIEIARRLEQANFSAEADPAIMRLKYAKLLINLGNALNAISPPGGAADDLLGVLREEGRACLSAAGIDWAGKDEVRTRRKDVYEIGDIAGVRRAGGSSLQSLMRGTGDIETDYLSGEIVSLGQRHGVPTPANAVVQRLASELARDKRPPRSIPIETVLQRIAEAGGQAAMPG